MCLQWEIWRNWFLFHEWGIKVQKQRAKNHFLQPRKWKEICLLQHCTERDWRDWWLTWRSCWNRTHVAFTFKPVVCGIHFGRSPQIRDALLRYRGDHLLHSDSSLEQQYNRCSNRKSYKEASLEQWWMFFLLTTWTKRSSKTVPALLSTLAAWHQVHLSFLNKSSELFPRCAFSSSPPHFVRKRNDEEKCCYSTSTERC